jgi:gentisate 1,2-dioxygenase
MTTSTPDALAELVRVAKADHAEPLWPLFAAVSPSVPQPKAVPYVWPYDVLRGYCERAAELVGTELAERRVLMLVNPALKAPFTTDTLFAGLQTILPGETARAHRHTPFALRFIIEGERSFTAVEGEKVMMSRGDLVLTPAWEWHDHGNESDRMMVWLDGLDHPIWQVVPAVFTEYLPDQTRYPSHELPSLSSRQYPWAEMRAELDAVTGKTAEVRYRHRVHGGDISRTIGASGVRIDPGAATDPIRETSSAIYHVYEGQGHAEVGDARLDWKRGDTFAVPAYRTTTLRNPGTEPVYLFRFDDKPLLDALGAYRSDRGA